MRASPLTLTVIVAAALTLGGLAGCGSDHTVSATPDSIGAATMLADGTIHLMLRAEGPGGAVGDAMFILRPGMQNYEATILHVGGLSPGESKSVPPWPAEGQGEPAKVDR
jgi:hypothetical protein